MQISIICPIYNEEEYIAQCIDSIISQSVQKESIELLLVDGMSTDKTRAIIKEYQQKYPFVKLLDNPQKIVPIAMNIGIRESHGEIIIRIDAHAIFPYNYIEELSSQLIKLNADNVGGCCITLPANQTPKAKAIAVALSSPFGVGNSYFRIGAKNIMEVDTVPFGCFSRTIFDKVGLYDTDLIRNQDDELNARIIQNGGKIILLPYLEVKYFARDSISKIRTMFYQYGLYKPLVNKKLGKPATVRQFFPVIFLTGLVLGGIISVIFPFFAYIYTGGILLYTGLALFFSIKKTDSLKQFLYLPYIFFTLHISYGLGYIIGIYKIITNKNFNAESNR